MQPRTSVSVGDGFRLSVSSTPSCSSLNSGPDDIESLGDVYVWGELFTDVGSTDGPVNPFSSTVDILIPKPLETSVVLDVHQISCGFCHIAIVTRQGEVFTWGEEVGGRLGHGIQRDSSQPQLVEFLSTINVDYVACGEYHTSAISSSGDLFTWGDGSHNAGLLGQGTDTSHWIPKRVSGPLDGFQVQSIACGTWHTALITSNGKLFTFGDGKFGALGHGDRTSVSYPKEVVHLNRLKSVKVACGVWHTAAIVEVDGHSGPTSNSSPKKLFTWGDGDKYRLGHGNKNTYLIPACVSALRDYNFNQIACGNTLTVALTTSGHVFTMGSNSCGQLGNANAEGKSPCLVQDKLVGEFVEEIACGAYHVAVLTSRSEMFTWGKGANGRLGHGDMDDRKSPTLVEALKDRHVKSIACGSSFTSSICIHKWVSGADQSVCYGCRQAFGFTRKRHNCYNCGLVHCHACSSKKALKAALAPTPNKPHRVCDACYNKLKSNVGSGTNLSKKATAPRRSLDISTDRLEKVDMKSGRILPTPSIEPVKYLEVKSQRTSGRPDSISIIRAPQVPSFQQMHNIGFPSALSGAQNTIKPTSIVSPAPLMPVPNSSSRSSVSSYVRRPGPPSTATPLTSRAIIDSLTKSNETLSQEITKLQIQIKTLKQNCKSQDEENQKIQDNADEDTTLASEPCSRCKVGKKAMMLVTTQLKELAEKIPADICESDAFKAMQKQVESFLEGSEMPELESHPSVPNKLKSLSRREAHNRTCVVITPTSLQDDKPSNYSETGASQDTSEPQSSKSNSGYAGKFGEVDTDIPESSRVRDIHSDFSDDADTSDADSRQSTPHRTRPRNSSTAKAEKSNLATEQFEPGVYVTFSQLRNGVKVLKRVRFSKRKFSEQQGEEWWRGNKERVLKKYAPPLPPPTTKDFGPSEDPRPPPPPTGGGMVILTPS